jgi:xylan 1,4-beta-xylosidase
MSTTCTTLGLSADLMAAGQPLIPYWNRCVGAGRAHEGLRANWQEHLGLVRQHGGMGMCRFHGLFHDDMFILRETPKNREPGEARVAGEYIYNFQYLDELFDRMLAAGVRPFVELGFCPEPLASVKKTCFWWGAHGSPPTDLAAWSELVRRTVQHLVDRYGHGEVRQWYFEVWNEPNLPFFFAGTRSQYYELYAASALAVKSVDPHLRVGGPATSNFVCDRRFDGEREGDGAIPLEVTADNLDDLTWEPVWVAHFLAWAGKRGLPVDFVSCHPYPTEFGFFGPEGKRYARALSRNRHALRSDCLRLREVVRTSPYPTAELHLTEWSSSPNCRDHSHDALPAAAFIIQAVLAASGLIDSLAYWAFTDVFEEQGPGNTAFHGGFGMISFQGLAKPSFHAYRMLNRLGSTEICRSDSAIVTRDSAGRVSALVWNYPSEATPPMAHSRAEANAFAATGTARAMDLRLSGLPAHARVVVEVLDAAHGDVVTAWERRGSQPELSRELTEQLRAAAWATETNELQADEAGVLHIQQTMAPWAVMAVRSL